jgi:hypothetical protein
MSQHPLKRALNVDGCQDNASHADVDYASLPEFSSLPSWGQMQYKV